MNIPIPGVSLATAITSFVHDLQSVPAVRNIHAIPADSDLSVIRGRPVTIARKSPVKHDLRRFQSGPTGPTAPADSAELRDRFAS